MSGGGSRAVRSLPAAVTGVETRRPEERTCERCGRRETWDDDGWRVQVTGEVFCVHDWDINGSFAPLRATDDDA